MDPTKELRPTSKSAVIAEGGTDRAPAPAIAALAVQDAISNKLLDSCEETPPHIAPPEGESLPLPTDLVDFVQSRPPITADKALDLHVGLASCFGGKRPAKLLGRHGGPRDKIATAAVFIARGPRSLCSDVARQLDDGSLRDAVNCSLTGVGRRRVIGSRAQPPHVDTRMQPAASKYIKSREDEIRFSLWPAQDMRLGITSNGQPQPIIAGRVARIRRG